MDLGYRGEDILWLVEHGFLTFAYQSTSYLTNRVPELGFVDLPFLFQNNKIARAAMDGELGNYLSNKTEEQINYRVLGYFENGFRHISNRLHPIHLPNDLENMRIRVLPSDIQAETFKLLGAEPHKLDLTEAIEGIKSGKLDAQENPFANTVTYDVHKFHQYHTKSNHFYISRGIFANRTAFYSWPSEIKECLNNATFKAIKFQREMAEKEAINSQNIIESEGNKIVELTEEEHATFVKSVASLHKEARGKFGNTMFEMLAN
jgi:TRAP-type C4-dicarboxylate transport system substrate-binding protein